MANIHRPLFSVKQLALTAAAVLFCFCLSIAPASSEDGQKAILTAEDAQWLVGVLLSGDASPLDGAVLLTQPMDKAVTASGGFRGLAQSIALLGSVKEIRPAYETTMSGMKAYRIPCRFLFLSVDLVVTTEDGALAGLVTAEYTGSNTENQQQTSENHSAVREVELAVPVPALDGEMPGTLTLPAGEGPFPAIILVHGSGVSDRDESVMTQKPFRDLSEGLAQKGIAVYRYDKRTYVYGEQLKNDIHLTLMDETVDDAAVAVQMLAQQEMIDPDRIYVLGHSLGGTAVPAIDQSLRSAEVKARGYIIMAGSARPLPELIKEQYDFLYSLVPEITVEQQAEKEALFHELDRLNDLSSLTEDIAIAGAYVPYWRWLAEYDVLQTAAGITAPCLVLQGEEDYQVTMEDYDLWKNAFKDNEQWKFISYPGLTHTFTRGLKTEGSAVYTRNEKVDQQVIDDIAQFILH